MLVWEIIVLVSLQLTNELKAFCRNLQKTDQSGGDSSSRDFPILDLLMLGVQYWENVLDIVGIYFNKSSMMMERWNRHLLAPNKDAILPRGQPICLCHLPDLFDSICLIS